MIKMKLLRSHNRILHFEFPTNKEMTLTFFRVEEHYESIYTNIREQTFSVMDFVETFMEDDGYLGYFENVYGFNVPGSSFKRFYERHADQLTTREQALLTAVKETGVWDDDFYVIASVEGDASTMDHELSHAIYYFSAEYRQRVAETIDQCLRLCLLEEMKSGFREIGYVEDVFEDEIQAFMCSTRAKKLRKILGCSATRQDRQPFKDLYNEFKDKFLVP